ncbi:MAG: hypothetical protein JWO84_191 [Parcubacteria group bacterium]|nr:hypothetical protein [Parcubacteria group bacterium]
MKIFLFAACALSLSVASPAFAQVLPPCCAPRPKQVADLCGTAAARVPSPAAVRKAQWSLGWHRLTRNTSAAINDEHQLLEMRTADLIEKFCEVEEAYARYPYPPPHK